MNRVRFIGLDVHAETIAVAVAEADGEVRSLGVIPNRAESIRKLVKKLGPAENLRACYEAGPTGYVVYWQLTALGVKCEVVAPTLVPVTPPEHGGKDSVGTPVAVSVCPTLPRRERRKRQSRLSEREAFRFDLAVRGHREAHVHAAFNLPLTRP